ncbi:MAG: hypothetical protein JO202_00525 [Ktedonobacteraceae bacterium]|nr:hypothetical protein [Ktedonobacteraceae bacterium]
MSYSDVARAAGVRPCVVYWMEQGIATYPLDAISILTVFSYKAGQEYTLSNVRGIRLKGVYS